MNGGEPSQPPGRAEKPSHAPPPLTAQPLSSPALQVDYAAKRDLWNPQQVRDAKLNCITLFVLFLVAMMALAGLVGTSVLGLSPPPGLALFLGCSLPVTTVVPGIILAMVFLPGRWRLFRSLSGTYRVLGWIGAMGLTALLLGGLSLFLLITVLW